MKPLRILIILVVYFIYQSGNAQVIIINKLDENIWVKNQAAFLEDKSGELTINDIISSNNFKPVPNKDIPNFGVTNSTYWFKLDILNNTPPENFLLQVSQPGLDQVELFRTNKAGKIVSSKSGQYLPFSNREFYDPNYIFRINLPYQKHTEIFLRVRSKENMQVPIIIGTPEIIFESNKVKDTVVGLYIGVMLVMLFYNAFLYITVRDKGYLFYVIYIATVILTQASLLGYTFQYLWPNLPLLARYSSFIFPPLVGIASIYFLRVFLHTASKLPKPDKFFHVFTVGYLIAVAFAVAGKNQTSYKLIEICASTVSIYMIVIAYLIHKQGYRPARFFLLAWTFFLIGVTIYVLKNVGVLPYNNFTNYTMTMGSAIEVVLLSFALADRINIYKKEKEESQAETLRALQKNEKLIKEQNIMLEQKVHERTVELEQTNNELNVTLKDLKDTQAQLVDAEKMASLGQLTAGIAHEINNPINFVSANIKPLQMDISDMLELINKYGDITPDNGIAEKLKEINLFKEQIQFDYVKSEIDTLLNGIEDGAKRTAEIVKGLKNFSHLDESDIKEADINQGIDSTLVLLRSAMPKNIEVVKNLGNIPIIECYPGKLNQVFMNIINNAIQAMEHKAADKHTLKISTYLCDEHVCVCIEDTGTGMTPEVKAKIFEPFFTTKDVGQGTGLGMSIVFKIIQSHNAELDIQSEPGVGTKMTLKLPKKLHHLNN